MSSYAKGLDAERTAYRFLRKKGYIFINHRYKTPHGEIDLIMTDKNTLVFIEVKKRPTLCQALNSISPRQKERMGNAALFFVQHNACWFQHVLRFDGLLIGPKKIVHIENIL